MNIFGKDPASRIKRAKLFSAVKSHVNIASTFANAALRLHTGSGVKDYVSVATLTLNTILKNKSFDPETSSDFAKFPFDDLVKLVSKACEENPNSERLRVEQNVYIVSHFDDQTFIVKNPAAEYGGLVFYKVDKNDDDQIKRLQNIIGRRIWENHSSKVRLYSADFHSVTFRKWDPKGEFCSDQTREVHENINKYLNKGYGRAVMLYGPPGTGKSCMTQYIAKELGWHTLYIDAESIHYLRSGTLASILSLLRPEVLIIDDMDRIHNTGSLLSTIDATRDFVKVFLVTINDKSSLDAAVKRCGRFDEIVLVKRILEPSSLFPYFNEKQLERIDQYPVAFLDELGRRIDVHGREIIDETLDEFDIRVKENKVIIKKDLKDLLGKPAT